MLVVVELPPGLIENSFGKSLMEIFETFETEPLASGAIAQIHKATLLSVSLFLFFSDQIIHFL